MNVSETWLNRRETIVLRVEVKTLRLVITVFFIFYFFFLHGLKILSDFENCSCLDCNFLKI